MKIVAMDIATTCGVAVGIAGGQPRSFSVNLGKPPDDRRFSKLLSLTSRLLTEHEPDLLAYEMPVGGPKTSHYLVGLIACVRGVAFNRGIRTEGVPISTVRRHFLGKHLTTRHFPGKNHAAAKKAIKTQVIARCGLLGWQVDDADCADAAALFDFASATWARTQSAPLGGLFNG